MIAANLVTRTGHTPEHKEKAPERLEVKTGKLEKRLLLRQFITKALAIKRAEIAESAGGGESENSTPNPVPGLSQKPPQKLTFYDVVQLARQQAFAEKTRRASEDLIDFSDTPQQTLNQEPLSSAQCDLALLDASDPMALAGIQPSLSSLNEPGMPELNQSVELTRSQPTNGELELTITQPASSELNVSSCQQPCVVDLLGFVEMSASQINDVHEAEPSNLSAPAETLHHPNIQHPQSDEGLPSQIRDADEKPAVLENISPVVSIIGRSDISLADCDQPSGPIQQSSTALIDHIDDIEEALTEPSPTSTAAPSIFSHSSSLTSATGSSLPGITEEDLQARSPSSQTSLRSPSIMTKSSLPIRRKVSGSAVPAISESEILGNDAELCRSPCVTSTTATTVDSTLPLSPELIQSEDNVSLSPSMPQLSNIDEPDEQGFPWIVQAARDGNEQLVRKLLISGADIKVYHTTTRRHALSEASIRGHQNIVDLLIEEGCPLEYPDAEGNTALHHACRGGNLAVAKSLLTGGALVNALGPQGETPLHLAIQVPHQNVVMLLIQNKASVNARDAAYRTPLHIGASQGNAAMCNYLLSEGAQLDSREAQSKTPLQLACEAGHYELVQMMLNQSKLNPTNMTFLTAFFAAVEHSHVRIAESFFPHGLKLQELKKDAHKPANLAAKSGCLAMVELMIQEDCATNASDENGWNALHFAAYHGHYQVIERLIASNVSAEAVTSRKGTPLLFATKGGHFAVVERLLRCQKDSNLVSAEDEEGQQSVHHAVRAGSVEIFNLLMSNGGKINVENNFGWQPLHIATAYGHLALVERLLQQGANIEEKLGSSSIKKDQTHKVVEEGFWAEARWPYSGSRPLHLACEYGHNQIVQYLISKGAKLEAKCSEGWQPLHHATYFGYSAMVELLLKGGVNPHAVTNEGKTAQSLGFCTSGVPIAEGEKQRLRNLLVQAMDKVKKQKTFKMALKRGSTVEEKNNLVRAATFSMDVVSRPSMNRAVTIAQASDKASPYSESSSHRPRLAHLPHTSPLPLAESRPQSLSSLHQAEAKAPVLPITTDLKPENTDSSVPEASKALTVINATDQPPLSSEKDELNCAPAPNTEAQISVPPEPKLKRRTTFGLAKVKPGIDMGKLGLAGMGKPAFDIGKQTFEIGKQTLELGNKTFEYGKQGLEMSKQGLEKKSKQGLEKSKQGLEAIQGLEMGKQSLNISKQGYKKAKKFANKGKIGTGKRSEKSKSIDGDLSKDGVEVVENSIDQDEGDDNEGSDDAGSVFSLGEFADLGNDDF